MTEDHATELPSTFDAVIRRLCEEHGVAFDRFAPLLRATARIVADAFTFAGGTVKGAEQPERRLGHRRGEEAALAIVREHALQKPMFRDRTNAQLAKLLNDLGHRRAGGLLWSEAAVTRLTRAIVEGRA